ncbi:MAG: phosphoribosylamine--glycine ligase [Synergistaceae bacterium]|jgi:phosphoribosylamine--glycine ligase|nr:phosphoribosylamine--glycine ligase [Synergistaceae bacterium]
MMKVLLIGSGGREHALAWKLAQSPRLTELYAAPGNPGIETEMSGTGITKTRLVPLKAADVDELAAFAEAKSVDLVVVGPEAPLALGLADRLREKNIPCFGPGAKGALLESSKKFAKDFMTRHGIPTAAYRAFSSADEGKKYLRSLPEGPIVVKADGLAQGKGVVVAETLEEASSAVDAMMNGRFGDAGREVVIEECMTGEEVSLLTFTDGKTILPMLPVQDHKRAGEGDTGPNTGGMGTYAPVSVFTPEVAKAVDAQIVRPLQNALRQNALRQDALSHDALGYRGCLYIGLMLTPQGPKVVEFNARFGDPETQVLMPLLETDLLEVTYACATGDLAGCTLKWRDEKAVCVVLASLGYPGEYRTGYAIRESPVPEDLAQNSWLFHAGTARNAQGGLVTAGGRVFGVTGRAKTLEEAIARSYARAAHVEFQDRAFRRDIAHREIKREKTQINRK